MTHRVTGPLVGGNAKPQSCHMPFWCSYMPSGNEWTRGRLIKTHSCSHKHTVMRKNTEEGPGEVKPWDAMSVLKEINLLVFIIM